MDRSYYSRDYPLQSGSGMGKSSQEAWAFVLGVSRVLSYLATRKQSLLASAGCAAVPRISMSDISIQSIAEKTSSRQLDDLQDEERAGV